MCISSQLNCLAFHSVTFWLKCFLFHVQVRKPAENVSCLHQRKINELESEKQQGNEMIVPTPFCVYTETGELGCCYDGCYTLALSDWCIWYAW